MRLAWIAAFLVSLPATVSADRLFGPGAGIRKDLSRNDFGGTSAPPFQARMAGQAAARAAAEVSHGGSHETGSLLWEDRHDASGFEQAFSATTLGDDVFVAGYVATPTGRDFLLRVLDEDTGELRWQDQVNRGGDEFASGVVTDHHRLFVSGTTFTPGTGYDWILRAYDTRTHDLLWEDVFDLAGRADFARGTALAAGGGMVFLGGYGTNPQDQGDFNTDWVVRAYDASSGELVWQDHIPGFSGAYTLTYHGGRLFAGGWTGTAQAQSALVRAYHARHGTRLWSRLTPGAHDISATYTKVVRAQGNRVFAAQSIVAEGVVFVPRVKAFDAATGALRWEDVIDDPGSNWINDLAIAAGRVFAVGYGGAQCSSGSESNCDAVVRAYGATSGTLLWKREVDLSGTDDLAHLVAANPERGSVYVDVGRRAAHLPARLLHGGAVGGQRLRRLRRPAPLADAGRVKATPASTTWWPTAGGSSFPAARSTSPRGEWDLIVRAYDTRGRRGAVVFPPLRQLTATGTSGTKSYGLSLGGPVTTVAHGLIPAFEQAGHVVDDPADDIGTALSTGVGVTFHTVSVPPGTRTLRVALFDEETDGTNDDLDLFVFDSDFNFVGSSGDITANEAVRVSRPPAGDYIVVVHGYETDGPDANYTLFSWTLGEAAAGNMNVSGPAADGQVTVNWSGLAPGGRYLGAVSYSNGTGEIGETLVSIRAVP